MSLHLTFDGGGSKLTAVVYDDSYNIIARRTSGGTNARFLGIEQVAQNCEDSLGGALDSAYDTLAQYPRDAIGIAVGPSEPLRAAIAKRVHDCKVDFIGEAYGCRLAGALDTDGCIVIAGTGSGVAWINGEGVIHRGGYGPELGDEGGGYYIGQRGLRAAVAAINGWGEPTALAELFMRYVGAKSADNAIARVESMSQGLYNAFYNNSDGIPRHAKIAGFAPFVGEACDSGDRVAATIIAEAGVILARQTAAMYRLYNLDRDKSVALCGGAWHASKQGALGRSFRAEFSVIDSGSYSLAPVIDALLPPFAAGAVEHARRSGKLDLEIAKLIVNFSIK
jgi:Predicted N-acetylglucosamine kinase